MLKFHCRADRRYKKSFNHMIKAGGGTFPGPSFGLHLHLSCILSCWGFIIIIIINLLYIVYTIGSKVLYNDRMGALLKPGWPGVGSCPERDLHCGAEFLQKGRLSRRCPGCCHRAGVMLQVLDCSDMFLPLRSAAKCRSWPKLWRATAT